jgi:hypothetical protein
MGGDDRSNIVFIAALVELAILVALLGWALGELGDYILAGLIILFPLGYLGERYGIQYVLLTLGIALAVCVAMDVSMIRETNARMQAKAEERITPTVDSFSLQEIGYIYRVETDTSLSERNRDIRWTIRIPGTNETYYCPWEGGYADFADHDGVVLIHRKRDVCNGSLDCPGFIVGLHGPKRGHFASVSAVDVDDVDYPY